MLCFTVKIIYTRSDIGPCTACLFNSKFEVCGSWGLNFTIEVVYVKIILQSHLSFDDIGVVGYQLGFFIGTFLDTVSMLTCHFFIC